MNGSVSVGRYEISLLNAASALGALLFVLAFFSRLPGYDISNFFSSDGLYLPSVYKDLVMEGGRLQEWNLNPAPNFFPDMLTYFVLMTLFHHSFIISSFVFSVLQFVAILCLLRSLLYVILPGISNHWSSILYLVLSFFLMEYLFFTNEYSYSFYLLSNAYHTGSFVMTLLCLRISLSYLRQAAWKKLLLLLFLGLLTLVSDRLFLVMFCVPGLISCGFMVRKLPLKPLLLMAATLLLTSAGGLLIFDLLSDGQFFHIDQPHRIWSFEHMVESAAIFGGQLLTYLSEFGFKAITILLFAGSFVAMLLLYFRSRKQHRPFVLYYAVFSIAFTIAVFGAPIVSGSYTGYDTFRYNVYPLYLGALNLPVFLACTLKDRRILQRGKYALAGLTALMLLTAISQVSLKELKAYFTYYPGEVKELDALAQREGLQRGAANYWEAKKITMFSRNGLKVCAVFEDLSPFTHVASNDWFNGRAFNFVLLNGFADTSSVATRVIPERTLYTASGQKLVKTGSFTYQNGALSPINTSSSE